MALVKITEKEQAAAVNEDASVLITQPGEADGGKTEVLRRAALSDVGEALETAGIAPYQFRITDEKNGTAYKASIHITAEGKPVMVYEEIEE